MMEKQQITDNSCGAASLLTAAIELGVTHIQLPNYLTETGINRTPIPLHPLIMSSLKYPRTAATNKDNQQQASLADPGPIDQKDGKLRLYNILDAFEYLLYNVTALARGAPNDRTSLATEWAIQKARTASEDVKNIANNDVSTIPYMNYNYHDRQYSMPSNIARCARGMLDLNVEVRVYRTYARRLLRLLYLREIETLETMHRNNEVVFTEYDDPRSTHDLEDMQNQDNIKRRELKILMGHRCIHDTGNFLSNVMQFFRFVSNPEYRDAYNVGALHYIMVRPAFPRAMDPSDGRNHSGLVDAKNKVGMRGTGVSIILSKR